ncbi:MAG TPA: hypothetical protein VMV45_16865 [Casimicrobiaceae bacterium]|nr:hypothetical protein [Casimicrobiaceae bacterium]
MRAKVLLAERWITLPVLVLACLVAAWAGYLVGAQKSFSRIPFYSIGQTITPDAKFAAFENWSLTDAGSLRSQGPRVAVLIRPRRVLDAPLSMIIKLRDASMPHTVTVSLNGKALGSIKASPGGGTYDLAIQRGALHALEDNDFVFVLEAGGGSSAAPVIELESLRIAPALGQRDG